MDVTKLAMELIANKFSNAQAESGQSALAELIGGNSGGLDLTELVGKMAGNGSLANIAQSWLGDGDNDKIDVSQISDLFGSDKLKQFSQQLGVSEDEASQGLTDILPNLVDKSSSGGNLLDAVGGIGGALDLAKKLF